MIQNHTTHRRILRALVGHPAQLALEQRLRCSMKQTARMAHLIDAMLDVACMANGQFRVNLTTVDFADVVHNVLDQLKSSGEMARSHCDMRIEVPDKVCGFWDRERLEQLSHHLLANALKYGAGKPVRVSLQEHAQKVVLSIEDHGIGIDAHARDHIFERYSKAASAYNYGGLGVGLYVVRQIAEALGGRITVDTTPGGGTTFQVALPRHCTCRPPT